MTPKQFEINNRKLGIESHEKLILIHEMNMHRSISITERNMAADAIDYSIRMIDKLTKELEALKEPCVCDFPESGEKCTIHK